MLLTFLSCALLQASDPNFGWQKPNWNQQIPHDHGYSFPECPDLNGDGIPEIIFATTTVQVLDGVTGIPWVILTEVTGHDYSYDFDFHDLDADGFPELILRDLWGSDAQGQLTVVHGGDGRILWMAHGREQQDLLGQVLYFQDADGDGLDDFLVGSERNGKIFVLNGLTGIPIWNMNRLSKRFHSPTPDWDGDGLKDVIVGGRGHLTALSGRTGLQIWNTQLHVLYEAGRWESRLLDINLDGTDDIVIAHPSGDFTGNQSAGLLEARDGKTGGLIWATSGTQGDHLGSNMHVEDYNGDGIADLLSNYSDRATLLNGANGKIIWQKHLHLTTFSNVTAFLEDLTGDGKADLLLTFPLSTNQGHRLELWDGETGITKWTATSAKEDEDFASSIFLDLNLDGVPDILSITPYSDGDSYNEGSIRAINGLTGLDLWKIFGGVNDELGREFRTLEIDSLPGPDLIFSPSNKTWPRSRFAVNGQTGLEIWRQNWELDAPPMHYWHDADIDGDGINEIIEQQWENSSEDRTVFAAFDPQSGFAIWEYEFSHIGNSSIRVHQTSPDFTGDGADEILLEFPSTIGWTVSLASYSTANMGYTSGLELSASQISASNGGSIQLNVDFPSEQAGWDYHLLLSENGTDPTNIGGLWVPLSPGYWLSSTYIGSFPLNLFSSEIGTLDFDGKALIQISALPNQIPSTMVGITMNAAVISREVNQDWEFSSGAATLEIIP